MATVIGIDLGTTNSVAAFKLAAVEVVTADDNTPPERKLTRSAVAWQNGAFVVGQTAYNQLRAAPESVVVSVKRLIGRGFADASVQERLADFHYKISKPSDGTDNAIAVWLDGREYAPEDISAEVLRKLAANTNAYCAQHALGQDPVTDVVITIPAYFNDKQRHATRQAAVKAGLNPVQLLPEPTAAAISYGFRPDGGEVQTILVYDLGGGTFDASLLTAADTQFIEQSKAGNLWLGGDDFDDLIVRYVKDQVAAIEGFDDVDALIRAMPHYQRIRLLGDLKMAAERAKVELSHQDATRVIPATPLLDDLGMAVTIDVEITRATFERLISPLVDNSVAICRQALDEATYSPDMVDAILLVGGSSQIPLVQQRMRAAFGDKVQVHERPMFAVAEGAAIVASGKAEKVGTTSRDYFIRLESNPKHLVIPRNEVLPFETSQIYRTVSDGQRLICMAFFNGDWVSKVDEPVGKMWLGLDQYYPAGTEVVVLYELDESSNHLQITAALKHDPRVKVSRLFSRGHSDEVVFERLEQLIDMARARNFTPQVMEEAQKLAVPVVHAANAMIDERTGEARPDMRRQAEEALKALQEFVSEDVDQAKGCVAHIGFVLEVCGFAVPADQQRRLRELRGRLETAIAKGDLSGMQAFAEETEKEFERLPGQVNGICYAHAAAMRLTMADRAKGEALLAKVGRLVGALKAGDDSQAGQIWRDIEPELSRSIDRSLPTGSISTGLTV